MTAPVTAVPASQTLARLAEDVVYGQLTVPVQRTYALAGVPQALADFAAGTRGKLAISVPDRGLAVSSLDPYQNPAQICGLRFARMSQLGAVPLSGSGG